MPKKSCKYCGIVPFNHVCPVTTKAKNDRDAKREDKSIYWSTRYRKLRTEVLEYQDNICLWSLYVEGKIVQANVCHHIIEIMIDDKLAYDKENFIGIDKGIHRDTVHRLYKIDKEATQDILRECMSLWNNGVKTEGLGALKEMLEGIKES
ncbi:hypothetical protein [Clostridium sp.]|jgi:5-methylcytosine-specific restriction protein A|uniref:hypothetical protein n=1 Tax=Clostridium sp. TaxID=1506 RepID=UPI003EEC4D13